jgi:LmbE family N-acetylglucosaminyl deacetylase
VAEKLDPASAAEAPKGPLRLWLVWCAAVSASIFAASVLLPSSYLMAGVFRPGAAGLRIRLDMFWMQYWGLLGPSAWVDDPARSVQAALGATAAIAALVTVLIALIRLFVTRDRVWPDTDGGSGRAYWTGQVGLGVAMASLAVLSLSAPVPARPLGWWFLALAGGSATLWVARRIRSMAPAACVLSVSASLALLVDILFPPAQALLVPYGWLELLAFAAATLAAVACVAVALGHPPPLPRAGRPGARHPGSSMVATLLAAAFGVMVLAVSSSAAWAPPSLAFGPVSGREVVVLAPHMDDEAAFAGETIAWLSRNGARVTAVFTTDSKGGTALGRDRDYIARRKTVMRAVVSGLGVSRIVVLDEVRDGDRMRGPRKVEIIRRRLAELGLVGPGTILITVSGTGQSDHRATFEAARSVAGASGLPLFVAWGYNDAHDTITRPAVGRPVAIEAGPAALAAKAAAVDAYIAFFQDRYPLMFPRILLAGRGAHDTLSVLDPPAGAGVSDANEDMWRDLP